MGASYLQLGGLLSMAVMPLIPGVVVPDGSLYGGAPIGNIVSSPSGGGGGTVLLEDLFTDANGTALASHTMNVGGGWTVHTGTFTIEGNKASCGTTGTASADAGRADGILSVICAPQDNSRAGLLLRYTDDNNYWFFRLRPPVDVELVERAGGSENVRASTNLVLTAGVEYTLRVVLSGASIVCTVDGANQISYDTAATGLSATRHGLFSTGVTTARTWNDFLMTK